MAAPKPIARFGWDGDDSDGWSSANARHSAEHDF